MNPGKSYLIVELLLLFVAMPLAFRLLPMRLSPLPALWLAALYCQWVMRRAGTPVKLWQAPALSAWLPAVLAMFALAAAAIALGVYLARPQLLFGFVRTHPAFWAAVMVLYPLLSVCPQGIIYRAFFVQRYGALFPQGWALLLASAAAFAFSHIIFRSPWSVALTFVAGLLFAWRYSATGSLLVSNVEHALYGCWMFTVGLGALFYHGAGRSAVG